MQEWTQRKAEPAKSLKDLSAFASPLRIAATMGAAIDRERASALDLGSGMRERLESHFGPMVSRVKFVESDLPASLGAKAIAQGDTVRVAPGAYMPGTASGERILSHELGHIVQQSRGEGMGGIAGMPMLDPSVERGADAIAESAMAGTGPMMTAAPAPAASAPMLGLGFLDIVRGWWRRRSMTKEEIDEAKRMVANRAWKVSADDMAADKYNPTHDPRLEEWQNAIRAAFNEGGSDDEKVHRMVAAFDQGRAAFTKVELPFADNMTEGNDPDGMRERLLHMARAVSNNPVLGTAISGFNNALDDGGYNEKTQRWNTGGAMMGVNTNAADTGTTMVEFNRFLTMRGEDARFVPRPPNAVMPAPLPTPQPAGNGDTGNGDADENANAAAPQRVFSPEELAERDRIIQNARWHGVQTGKYIHSLMTSSDYAGNHELGHLAALLVAKKRKGLLDNGNAMAHDAEVEQDVLKASIRHLINREKKNKYFYDDADHYGGMHRFMDFFSKFSLNFGDNRKKNSKHSFVAKDRKTKERVLVKKAGFKEGEEAARAALSNTPEMRAYNEEQRRRTGGNRDIPMYTDFNGNSIQANPKQAPYFDKNIYVDTRKKVEKNRDALYEMHETSSYGATMPAETIAEAFADVDARGKGATRLNKQAYKRVWRELNPDAAYEEYLQKKEKKASQNPTNRYFKWAHRNDR